MLDKKGSEVMALSAYTVVIPGRREAASPESIVPGGGYGFRAPSLRSGPGMTADRTLTSDGVKR